MFLASKKMKKKRGRERSSMMPPFLLLPYMQSGTYVEGQVPIYLSPAQALNIFLPSRDLMSSPSLSSITFLILHSVTSPVHKGRATSRGLLQVPEFGLPHRKPGNLSWGTSRTLLAFPSQTTFHQDVWKPQLTIISFRTPRSLRLKLRAICHTSLCWWTGLVSTSLPPAVVDIRKPTR